MHHAFALADAEHNVELSRGPDGYRLHIGDRMVAVSLQWLGGQRARLTVGSETCNVYLAARGDDVYIHLDGQAHHLHYEHPLERLAHQAHGAAEDHLRAPMPGSLVTIHVAAGESVTKGQALLVMESMKMETTLVAARDGVVEAVHFALATPFDRDALLVSLVPAGSPPPGPLPQGEGEKA